jgi:3-oxoacyl-[acyl-carrier protein] reductase
MSADDWNAVIDTNLNGVFHYAQLAVRSMLRRGGVILNITSVSGILGIAGQTNYGASKAAVVGLTKGLAKEVARFEIRVNAIAPGFIETDMIDGMPEAAREKAFAQIPMRKPGDPAQVAQLALYLASPQASYITGQVFPIDGGLS